jgi:hypothetical protein
MHSVPAEATQIMFAAKAAVALRPIVILLTADVIGWFLRRTLWRRAYATLALGSIGEIQMGTNCQLSANCPHERIAP